MKIMKCEVSHRITVITRCTRLLHTPLGFQAVPKETILQQVQPPLPIQTQAEVVPPSPPHLVHHQTLEAAPQTQAEAPPPPPPQP